MAKRPSGGAKKRLRRGLWSPEEDEKLMNHIAKYGNGCWSSVPKIAGLERCGKSCRLRWLNYLRPDLKRGAFSQEEEDLIIHLHSVLGNKWSQIAAQLPGRTDNEVKNFWNSFIKKKLRSRGIDPATHKPLAFCTTTAPVFRDHQHAAEAEEELLVMPPLVAMEDGGGRCSHGGYNDQAAAVEMEFGGYSPALHGGAEHLAAGVILPSVSSSSTLTSMAGVAADEHCNNHSNSSGDATNHLPWLELGSFAAVGGDHYGAALDELRWSDYVFDGGYGGQQGGQCIYGDDDTKDVGAAAVHGLGNWCLN